MRSALLLALLFAGCRSRIEPERASELYGGVGVLGLPSVGGQVTAGQYFSKKFEKFDFAFELRGAVQGGDDSATQDGRFYQVQMGVKQLGSPGHDRRPFFRYGITWFRANGDPAILGEAADYLGAYAGVGYEWRLGKRWWIGPEATAILCNGEATVGTEFLPQVGLSLTYDF